MSVVSHLISGTSIFAKSLDVTLGLGDFISALSDVALSGDEFLKRKRHTQIHFRIQKALTSSRFCTFVLYLSIKCFWNYFWKVFPFLSLLSGRHILNTFQQQHVTHMISTFYYIDFPFHQCFNCHVSRQFLFISLVRILMKEASKVEVCHLYFIPRLSLRDHFHLFFKLHQAHCGQHYAELMDS